MAPVTRRQAPPKAPSPHEGKTSPKKGKTSPKKVKKITKKTNNPFTNEVNRLHSKFKKSGNKFWRTENRPIANYQSYGELFTTEVGNSIRQEIVDAYAANRGTKTKGPLLTKAYQFICSAVEHFHVPTEFIGWLRENKETFGAMDDAAILAHPLTLALIIALAREDTRMAIKYLLTKDLLFWATMVFEQYGHRFHLELQKAVADNIFSDVPEILEALESGMYVFSPWDYGAVFDQFREGSIYNEVNPPPRTEGDPPAAPSSAEVDAPPAPPSPEVESPDSPSSPEVDPPPRREVYPSLRTFVVEEEVALDPEDPLFGQDNLATRQPFEPTNEDSDSITSSIPGFADWRVPGSSDSEWENEGSEEGEPSDDDEIFLDVDDEQEPMQTEEITTETGRRGRAIRSRSRPKLNRRQLVEDDAAKTLQKSYRGHLAVLAYQRERRVIRIQKFARCFLAVRRFPLLKLVHTLKHLKADSKQVSDILQVMDAKTREKVMQMLLEDDDRQARIDCGAPSPREGQGKTISEDITRIIRRCNELLKQVQDETLRHELEIMLGELEGVVEELKSNAKKDEETARMVGAKFDAIITHIFTNIKPEVSLGELCHSAYAMDGSDADAAIALAFQNLRKCPAIECES